MKSIPHPTSDHLQQVIRLILPILVAGIGLAVFLSALITPSTAVFADGTVLYVSPNGTDATNPCTNSASPCKTIQHAVDSASNGDEIRVATGVYTNVHAGSAGSVVMQVVEINTSVALAGGYAESDWTTADPTANPTTIDAEGNGIVLYIRGDVNVSVSGFTLQNGNANSGIGTEDGGGVWFPAAPLPSPITSFVITPLQIVVGLFLMMAPSPLKTTAFTTTPLPMPMVVQLPLPSMRTPFYGPI